MGRFSTLAKRDFIYVTYSHNNSRFQVSTGFKVSDPKNPKPNLQPQDPQYHIKQTAINKIMEDMFTANTRLRTARVYPDVHAMRREYFKVAGIEPDDIKTDKTRPFWDMFDELIEMKTKTLDKATIGNYNQFRRVMENYCSSDEYEIEFHTFDNVQFGRYLQHMTIKEKLSDSSIHKHVKILNAIFKWSYPSISRDHLKYKWENIPNIYPLYEGELRHLIEEDDIPPFLDITRDLFVFCCCTGMNYKDSQKFRDFWIDKGMIAYTKSPANGKILAPLVNAANKVLVKYGTTTPKISLSLYNFNLKELFKHLNINRAVEIMNQKENTRSLVPFFNLVSAHTPEMTFITLALERGVPVQDVMFMSGHFDLRVMLPYIKISREHLKEEAKKIDW